MKEVQQALRDVEEEQLPGVEVLPVGTLEHRMRSCPAHGPLREKIGARCMEAIGKAGLPVSASVFGLFPVLDSIVPEPHH